MSDLRAAAERLRRVLQGESLHGIYGSGPVPRSQETRFQRDCEELAHAYLASLPPDGETEIDEAWLVKVGFKLNTSTAWSTLFPYTIHSRQWRLAYRPPGSGLYGKWYLGPAGGATAATIPPLKTRSDLRGLCEKLGIPLKEEKEA